MKGWLRKYLTYRDDDLRNSTVALGVPPRYKRQHNQQRYATRKRDAQNALSSF